MRLRGKRTNDGAINICRRNISFPLPLRESTERRRSSSSRDVYLEAEVIHYEAPDDICGPEEPDPERERERERPLRFFGSWYSLFGIHGPTPNDAPSIFALFESGQQTVAAVEGRRGCSLVPPLLFSLHLLVSLVCIPFFFLPRAQDLEVDVRSLVRERY